MHHPHISGDNNVRQRIPVAETQNARQSLLHLPEHSFCKATYVRQWICSRCWRRVEKYPEENTCSSKKPFVTDISVLMIIQIAPMSTQVVCFWILKKLLPPKPPLTLIVWVRRELARSKPPNFLYLVYRIFRFLSCLATQMTVLLLLLMCRLFVCGR